VFPRLHPALPVFGIALAAELWQWLGLTQKLGLDGTVLGVVLGATADWKDIVCYGLGCLLFSLTEYLLRK
jgi:cell shape-determining protein MreD